MKRSELKQLLKECLIEILTEEPVVKQKLQEAVRPKSGNSNAKQLARQMTGADEFEVENEAMLLEQINIMAASASGGNKKQAELMRAIFADTAMNTLQEQKEIAPGMTQPDMHTGGVELEGLAFGGDVSRWASVAFNGKK